MYGQGVADLSKSSNGPANKQKYININSESLQYTKQQIKKQKKRMLLIL
jgi:hypothetical protein